MWSNVFSKNWSSPASGSGPDQSKILPRLGNELI